MPPSYLRGLKMAKKWLIEGYDDNEGHEGLF